MGLSAKILEVAYKQKWFKIFVSKQFDGLACTLPEGLAIIRKCNKQNGSLGWCVNLGSGANYFSGFFPVKGAATIFQDPKCVLAGSGGMASEVIKTEGGYLVTGKWAKATGSSHATYFTCNAELPNGETVSIAMDANKITVFDDWHLFGMKDSSSFGYSSDKLFVPEEFVFKIDQPVSGSGYAIHQLPFLCFAQFCMTAAIIGLAEGVAKELKQSAVKEKAKGALNELNKATTHFNNLMNDLSSEVWQSLLLNGEVAKKAEIEKLVQSAGRSLYKAVANLYFKAGLVMADETTAVHESYRDFMVAIQHALFK